MIEIREYNVEDTFAVVDMLVKIADGAGKDLVDLFAPSSDTKSEKPLTEEELERQGYLIIVHILQKCYEGVRPILVQWFASLCGKSKEEFLRMPPETVLDVIEQIATRKESKTFFSRACQLFKKIRNIETTTTGE